MVYFKIMFTMFIIYLKIFLIHTYACTEFMIKEGQHFLVGRNFDWPNSKAYMVVNPVGIQHGSSDFKKIS